MADWTEKQATFRPQGHVLTNAAVWSPDGRWIVYDVRSDAAGTSFDGTRIERVHVDAGDVQILYSSTRGACCGVATCSPVDDRVVFIHGPERPTVDWQYGPYHRQGVIVHAESSCRLHHLDARDVTPPYTPGALRGGSHVHQFSGDGRWVSFTYEDHVLATAEPPAADPLGGADLNQRNIGVAAPAGPVVVPRSHPRNHDGEFFSVVATRSANAPAPGSDEISRAEGDAWVGTHGYLRPDGTRQSRAIAFLGDVVDAQGRPQTELFIVDLPDDVTCPGDGPLEGTPDRRPAPPRGARQRRITFTADRRHPGIQGPRHWPRSSPDGARIAFLMRDDAGVVQLLWTVSPNGGSPKQATAGPHDVASAFTWHPDGTKVALVADDSVWEIEVASGAVRRLTPRRSEHGSPRPEACVYSPSGDVIAFVRVVAAGGATRNQIFVIRP